MINIFSGRFLEFNIKNQIVIIIIIMRRKQLTVNMHYAYKSKWI